MEEEAPVGAALDLVEFAGGSTSSPVEIKIRKEFPETWIWDLLDNGCVRHRDLITLAMGCRRETRLSFLIVSIPIIQHVHPTRFLKTLSMKPRPTYRGQQYPLPGSGFAKSFPKLGSGN